MFSSSDYVTTRAKIPKKTERRKSSVTSNRFLPLAVFDSLWCLNKCFVAGYKLYEKWNNFQPSMLFKIHGILLRSGQKPAVRLTDDVPFTARARVYLNVHLNIIKQEITCSISPAMAIESGVCGLICPLTWNSNPIRPLFPASRLPALKTHLPCF